MLNIYSYYLFYKFINKRYKYISKMYHTHHIFNQIIKQFTSTNKALCIEDATKIE